MPGLVYELMDALEKQAVHFDELIALCVEKKELIINNSTAELSKITADENAIVNKVQKLDKTRTALMLDIANVIGRTKDLTLTELADAMAGQKEHGRLIEIIMDTKNKLEQLKLLNDQNKALVDSSLDYINFTINAIRTSLLPEQAIYSPNGEELGARQSFFDAKQ